MPDIWKASDPKQQEVPFGERVASVLIAPWQYAFLGMLLFETLEAFVTSGPVFLAFSTLSSACAVVAAALAQFVIMKITNMQHAIVPDSPHRRGLSRRTHAPDEEHD